MCVAALAAPGDWPMWRHDTSLTASQPVPGAMTNSPRVLAKYFLGAGQGAYTFADLHGTGKTNDVLVAARSRLTAYDEKGRKLWESNPEGYVLDHVEWVTDLDGDGQNEVVAVAGHMGITRQAYLILDARTGEKRAAIEVNTGDFSFHGHCGAYLAKEKGKQIFLVTSMRQSDSGPAKSFGEFSLWSFDGHSAIRRWGWSPTEQTILYASTLVADLNGDGNYHAVVDSWCHVWNIDLATGAATSHTAWDPQGANKRHYGWNEVVDVDGDGKLDFVNVSMTKHVEVLRNVGGKLELAWTHGWPDPVTTEARSLVSPSDAAVDIDGDGKKEIISALFDGLTDKRWHLSIFDGATGAEKASGLDLVPIATMPLAATNGARALLCVRSTKIEHDPPESYEVLQLVAGKLQTVWSSATNSFVLEGGTSNDRRFFAFNSMNPRWPVTRDVDGDGHLEFFTTNKTGKIQAWGLDRKGRVVAKKGKLPVQKARSLPRKIPPLQGITVPYLLAVDLYGRGRNDVLLYDNANATVLRLDKHQLNTVEKIPSTEIPIVCDLLGDGQPCVLTGGRATDGNLWIEARDARKRVLWHFNFPHSGACGQYSERPHYFTVGHFTGRKHLDVFTYSTKPEARTYVLDGRTGKMVWQRDAIAGIERHFQAFGGRASVTDFNHDGADEVLFCNPDYYCVADGKTGNLLVGPVEISTLQHWWAAYASPTALENKGNPVVYLGGVYSSRGSIALDGTRGLWNEYLPTERWPLREGNSGFNEGLLPPTQDRGWTGAQMEADGTLVCYDVANGKHFWQTQVPTSISAIVSGDVDGDGRPELVFGGRDGALRVMRDAGNHCELLWQKNFDAPVTTVILADINGDGKSEIIASVGDGYVYVLGQ